MIGTIGKLLVIAGIALTLAGAAMLWADRLGWLRELWQRVPLGRLPGDVNLRGNGFSVYFPWVTCLVISVVVSLLVSFFRK